MTTRLISGFIYFCIIIYSTIISITGHTVGSGGILNLVPQARVWLEDKTGRHRANYKVYVHPLEGSIVLIRSGENSAIALDKNKKQAVTFDITNLAFHNGESMLDVPENIPYKVLAGAPHFNRTRVSVTLGDGARIIVDVER